MKKLPWVIVVVLLGVIAYIVFKDGREAPVEVVPTENSSETPSEDIQKVGPILDGEEQKFISEETQYLKITAKYPAFDDKDKSDYIERVIREEINTFKESLGIDDMSQSEKDFVFGNGTKYEFNTTYKIYSTENTASVVFSISTYTGGAHGGLVMRSLNFNRSTEGLTIGDLFKPGSSYLTQLSEVSRAKLKATLKNNSGEWYMDGTTAISKNFETFYLTEGVLHIIFQPYQVGPWVVGAPEITLDIKSELKDVISSTFLNE